MATLIEVINETAQLVESPLDFTEPLLTNNYDEWTQDPIGGFDVSPGVEAIASSSPEDSILRTYNISKTFYLDRPARTATLTVQGLRTIDHSRGYTEALIILTRPDSSVTYLYSASGVTPGLINYLNSTDIAPYLNQAGTYTIRFVAEVSSGFVVPETYYISTSEFHDITFAIDQTLPSEVTSLSAHAENTTQVHLLWAAAANSDYYKIYYKKTTASTWSYVTTYDTNRLVLVDSGIMYDFYVVGVNPAGEGTPTATIQARAWGTFTQNFYEATTPTDQVTPNRIRYVYFSESTPVTEVFNTQTLTAHPVSTVILLCGYTDYTVYTFEPGLVEGHYDTPEITFGYPDKEKTLVEIRFNSEAEHSHTVIVYVSIDSGSTWSLIGSDSTGLGKTGFVYPWLTSNKFLIRFSGIGLSLTSYEVYALPSGWKIKP